MPLLFLAIRVLLSAVFATAAVSKLMDSKAARQAVEGFGVPARFAGALAAVLPWLELTAALCLLPSPTVFVGSLLSLALMLAFTVVVAANLAKGKHPDCHCFGQIRPAPISAATLVRNSLLLLLSGSLVFQNADAAALSPWAGIVILARDHIVSSIIAAGALLVAAQTWVVVHLLRQHGRILSRVSSLEGALRGLGVEIGASSPLIDAREGLAPGSPAPLFTAVDMQGEPVSLPSLLALGPPALLIFADADCNPCRLMMPDVASWQARYAQVLTIAVIAREVDGAVAQARQEGLTRVLFQKEHEISERFNLIGTPSAVLIQPDGAIGNPGVLGAEAIASLVASVATPRRREGGLANIDAGGASNADGRSIGQPTPAFELPDLDGALVPSHSFLGQNLFLLFWNPACSFCESIRPELLHWEERRGDAAPRLVVVTTAVPDRNRSLAFASAVLLDQRFSVGSLFGITGTPSALLIDAEGKLASSVVAGERAILALASAVTKPAATFAATGSGH